MVYPKARALGGARAPGARARGRDRPGAAAPARAEAAGRGAGAVGAAAAAEAGGAAEYEVEAIVGHKGRGKKLKFCVKWRHYPHSRNTWEGTENFVDDGVINAQLWAYVASTPRLAIRGTEVFRSRVQ